MDEQSGQTIAPNGNTSGQASLRQPSAGDSFAAPENVTPSPASVVADRSTAAYASDAAARPSPAPQVAENNGWRYGDDPDTLPSARDTFPDDISWTAAEFLEHQKSTGWYLLLTVVALVAATVDFLFTHDPISTGVIVMAAALFGAYAGHKPRTQQYYLSPQGLQIGEKLYVFQGFRNFSVIEEGSLISIVFMPLKRFAPSLTIYVARDIEDRVLDYLSEFLPFEQHQADAVDGLLRRIRF